MRCNEIIEIIEEQWPRSYACSWDNVGLLVGDGGQEVRTILLALDVTDDIIRQAKEVKADLLITHHPMIFRGIKQVTADDFTGRRVIELVRSEIACYAMHTNFDVLGMGAAAAERLQLQNCTVLEYTGEENGKPFGIGQIGALPEPQTLRQCAELVKASFGLEHVRIFGAAEHIVERAAISPGSGSSEINQAIAAGADVLITGDIDHHDGLDAMAQGLSIIDAGHYGLESIFSSYMCGFLGEKLSAVKVMCGIEQSPFRVL